ncbi:hypothetical protein D9M68_859740 [compost metagenome]
MAGTNARPLCVSHNTAVARCVAIASAAISCPCPRAWAIALRHTSIVFSRMTLASCSTTPGRGVCTCSAKYSRHDTWPSADTVAARVPDVPSSMARITLLVVIARLFR